VRRMLEACRLPRVGFSLGKRRRPRRLKNKGTVLGRIARDSWPKQDTTQFLLDVTVWTDTPRGSV